MTPVEAIGPERLIAASRDMVAQAGFAARISWWLQHAHAAERWIQFEWAFNLQAQVSPHFGVLCEHGRYIDITLVPALNSKPTLRDLAPSAGIELKWYGNWWVDDFSSVRDDLAKVREYAFPAAAVLLFLQVQVKQSAAAHQWRPNQVATGRGLESWQAVDAILSGKVGEPHVRSEHPLDRCDALAAASLYTIAFYNEPARVTP